MPYRGYRKPKEEFKCETCDYVTCRKNYLDDHMRVHTGERPFTCDICGKGFTQKSNLNQHLKTHGKGRQETWSCKICPFVTKWKSSYQIHERWHRGEKPYECKICHRKFSQSTHCQTHIKEQHLEKRDFQCDRCSKKFKRQEHLLRHMMFHNENREFECKTCGKKFHEIYGLRQHERIHLGEAGKIFHCNHCQYKSFFKQCLVVHARIHSGIKPYRCTICNKCFRTSSSLKLHNRMRHQGLAGKIFQCPKCPFSTANKQSLKNHDKRIHLGISERLNIKCSYCNRTYMSRSSYYGHRAKRHGELWKLEKSIEIRKKEPLKISNIVNVNENGVRVKEEIPDQGYESAHIPRAKKSTVTSVCKKNTNRKTLGKAKVKSNYVVESVGIVKGISNNASSTRPFVSKSTQGKSLPTSGHLFNKMLGQDVLGTIREVRIPLNKCDTINGVSKPYKTLRKSSLIKSLLGDTNQDIAETLDKKNKSSGKNTKNLLQLKSKTKKKGKSKCEKREKKITPFKGRSKLETSKKSKQKKVKSLEELGSFMLVTENALTGEEKPLGSCMQVGKKKRKKHKKCKSSKTKKQVSQNEDDEDEFVDIETNSDVSQNEVIKGPLEIRIAFLDPTSEFPLLAAERSDRQECSVVGSVAPMPSDNMTLPTTLGNVPDISSNQTVPMEMQSSCDVAVEDTCINKTNVPLQGDVPVNNSASGHSSKNAHENNASIKTTNHEKKTMEYASLRDLASFYMSPKVVNKDVNAKELETFTIKEEITSFDLIEF